MIKIANAQLWVHDQEEALAFYTEKVGFEVQNDVTLPEMGDFRWLTVGPPNQDVSIVLMAIPGEPMVDAETAGQIEALMSKGFAGTVFLTMLAASFASFLVGQALLGDQLSASLSDAGALRSVLGAALYLTVAGLTAIALGALLRNTAAAITTFVAVFFVIPPLTLLLPASLTDRFVQYLPANIGGVLTGGTSGVAHPLAPWTGFAVLCGYAAVLIAFAAWRLRRVDA